jgi:hypothetical protein
VLQEIEREDQAWEEANQKKTSAPRSNVGVEDKSQSAARPAEEIKKAPQKTNAPSGFY